MTSSRLAALAALLLLGCSSSTDVACTELGCPNSKSVVVTAATGVLAIDAYQVLVESVIGVQVLTDNGVVQEEDHDPEGVISQPNGEGCEPICTFRQLDLELDGD